MFYNWKPIYNKLTNKHTHNNVELDNFICLCNKFVDLFAVEGFTDEIISEISNVSLYIIRTMTPEEFENIFKNEKSKVDNNVLQYFFSEYEQIKVSNFKFLNINDKIFVTTKNDYNKWTNKHKLALFQITKYISESNPIYVELNSENTLEVE